MVPVIVHYIQITHAYYTLQLYSTYIVQVQLNVRYIAVTLLHQNLTHASVKGDLTPPQVVLSHNYFSEIAEVVTNNYVNDAANIRAVLNKVGL